MVQPAVERVGIATSQQPVPSHGVGTLTIGDLQQCRGLLTQVRARLSVPTANEVSPFLRSQHEGASLGQRLFPLFSLPEKIVLPI